ncbi:MAG: tRNA adenosine(34) deaminase TadA [Elusimicrobiota bacterium]
MKSQNRADAFFMKEALKEARKAQRLGEVPVGAVVVVEDRVIGRGYNRNIKDNDPSAHAEIVAIGKAAKKLRNYRLIGCKIYATIEPCPMCAGALVWARISEIVFGAKDLKAGACGSVVNIAQNRKLNHRIKITGGVLENECRSLIQNFFRQRRKI